MRAGLSTIQQTLTPEAASVLNHSIGEAGRRNHGQTTPLHVAATLLSSPNGFLRQACIKSHPNSSHPLQCRALELCFSVALERLPTAQSSSPTAAAEPPISNALMAALKRAQAHQRRGCPEQQQQPLLAVKVELEQLIISILDDPSVSRVMREASFSSPAVKATIEQSLNSSPAAPTSSGLGFRGHSPAVISAPPARNLYLNPRLQQQGSLATPVQQRGEDVRKVFDILLRSKKRNPVLVGESEPEAENLHFDVDARINLFECNIRVLGGLVSAHVLATDSTNRLARQNYKNQLLVLAEDLGNRLLPAFNTPTGLPYAWINLKHGVMENETTETSTSGCGSLILEMGALSRLTGDPRFESAALRALRKLWSMRSSLNLLGTTLDVETGEWIEFSSGIGAGVDSFYEYLFKAHVLFGKEEFWRMFHTAYLAVQKYFRHGPWYHEADMRTGRATYWQLTSLQAFWPGLQVLVGDIPAANSSHREFFYVWEKYGVLPERYLLDHQMLHPTEKYYPLRPELAESTFYLYQATKDPWYFEVGESIMKSLVLYTKVEGGFASVRDVTTMQLEDHQHSFFLSETCKYLYLLFDDSFLVDQNYIFTTEGHPLPVLSSWHERLPEVYGLANGTSIKGENSSRRLSAMSLQVCPASSLNTAGDGGQPIESACHILDARADHRCFSDEECGVDSTTCRRRSCSTSGYCGLWLHI